MGKFLYRMQSVLDLKLKMETMAKQDFATAVERVNAEERKLQELKIRKKDYEKKAKELLTDVLSLRDIQENSSAIHQMDSYIKEQEEKLKDAKDFMEKEREKLSEAMKERKTHENLKEKAFDEFLREENKREGITTDELTSYRYSQKE